MLYVLVKLRLIFSLFFPDFVVTITTPLAALTPYIAAEAASFKIEMVSISLGSRLSNGLSTPSTIIKGAPEPVGELLPLIKNLAEFSPGTPLCCLAITPGNLPESMVVRLSTGFCESSRLLSVATEPVK